MSRTITVVGENGTIDSDSSLTGQASVATASTRPDSGYTKIKKIFFAIAGDAAADGGTAIGVTFPGQGVLNGPHRIILGAAGGELTAGADNTSSGFGGTVEDVDIPINGNDITIQLSLYGGVDPGTISAVFTLYLE